jgi:bis(5'-nucleosyl)-tetraphosphatase (symmetrical)
MDYAIGDVQGCFKSLKALLNTINFNIDRDRLYFLGDVVNRGNNSLETLRFIQSNQGNMDMVLGNHDFHLLVCALTERMPNKNDTFLDILTAPDKTTLLDYLLSRRLVIEYKDALFVHAGIPPQWSKSDVIQNAEIVHKNLESNNASEFLSKMYRNHPNTWSNNLSNEEASRYTINALMRMRFCKENGELEFEHKLNFDQNPKNFAAWFLHSNRLMADEKIFFGHWSSLKNVSTKNIYPLDHGCVWGDRLTAYDLTNQSYISQKSLEIS